jgi:transketolase
MRDVLSDLIVATAKADDRFIMLSGDHGYALFDAIRAERPNQFVNVGVAEQNMIGVAAGLAKVGFRPCVYGLAAFVPIRVLEQIKLDLCHARLPVILLGDGAGLVYSTLGVSHQCGEDIACLRPLPNISVYSPCDAWELIACWREAREGLHPSYIRLGKADRPAVHQSELHGTTPIFSHRPAQYEAATTIVATGSMVAPCTEFAAQAHVDCISVPRIKPFPGELLQMLPADGCVVVVEEHAGTGGLWSSVVEAAAQREEFQARPSRIQSVALRSTFTRAAGTWQQALHEHDLNDAQLYTRLTELCARVP